MKILQKDYRSKKTILGWKLSPEETDERYQWNEIFKKWCRDNRIVKECGWQLWPWLHGRRTKPGEKYFPGQDHLRAYKTEDGSRVIVFQPYQADWDELGAFCKERGLELVVKEPSESWHFNGSTYLVEVRLAST